MQRVGGGVGYVAVAVAAVAAAEVVVESVKVFGGEIGRMEMVKVRCR